MIKYRVALAALVCVGAACSEDQPLTTLVSPVTMVPPGVVQVVIQQDMTIRGDSAVFIVSIVPNGVPVAAYQGAVTFAPEGMQVTAVRTAESKDGEYRIVNSQELASGKIRFAVFAPEALATTEAFRIVAHVNGGLAAAKLVGALDVVGQADGAALGASQMRSSVGVYDAASNALLVP